MFHVCRPDRHRAKGLHAGGCQHPIYCIQRGECYYGISEEKHSAVRETVFIDGTKRELISPQEVDDRLDRLKHL